MSKSRLADALDVMDSKWPGYLTAKQLIRAEIKQLQTRVLAAEAEVERGRLMCLRTHFCGAFK